MKSFTERDVIQRAKDCTENHFSVQKDSIGIGDDCSVYPSDIFTGPQIVTTDSLVEGIHFQRQWISAQDLGYKSLAVSLSDIAAMGGVPRCAYLALSLPRDLSQLWMEGFFEGLSQAAEQYGVKLQGGDTTASRQDIFINVTLIGDVPTGQPKLRKGSRVGDKVYVSKPLGDASAGLMLLQKQQGASCFDLLKEKFSRPLPEIELGRWLAGRDEVTAMMDLSDGLVLDLEKMMQASGFGFDIRLEDIPISLELRSFCQEFNLWERDFVISGGEDYALLFTVKSEGAEKWHAEFVEQTGRRVYCIGQIVDEAKISYSFENQKFDPTRQPFEHF